MTKALNDTVSTQCGNEDDEELLDISCPQTVADYLDHFCTCIKTFVPSNNSDGQTYPILIICTHRDKCTDREVLQYQKRLYNYLISTPYRYQIHVEFFLMSNKIHDESKIGQIRETIISLGRDQSCKIPQSWMTFKGELVGCTPEHEPMRTWEEAKIAGQKVGIEENKLVEVLSALNDVGELFFIDDDRLRNFIVTDPRWLLQQLQRVTTPSRQRNWTLDDDICPDSRGLLQKTSLHKVWSEDVRTHLCYLMERLRMLFSITATEKARCSQTQKGKRYLVPCLLQSAANLNLQEGTIPPVVLTSSTRFLPVGLTASLIVAMIEEEKWTLTGGIYKDAATFLPKGYDSSIKLSISERNFKIYVGGKNLTGNDLCTDFRDGLKVVMNRLNRVLSTFNTEMSFSLGIFCPGAKEGDAPLELGECGDAYKKEMYCELHDHRCDVSGFSVWFCKDADQFQELSHSDKVTPKPMEILSELVDQMVQHGASEAMFVCECSSQGATAIWQKSGVQITSDDKYQIDVDGGKHTLVIRNVVHEDSGEYAIVFSCGNSLQARLQVEGIAATRTKLKEAVNVLLDELEDDEARLVGPTGIAARAADLSFLAQIKELRILLDGDVSNIETKGTPDAKAKELIRYLLPCHTPQLVKFMWVMIQVNQSHQFPKSMTGSVKKLLSRYNKTGIKQLADSMDHGGQVNEPPELLQKLDDQQVYTSSTAELTCRIREGDPEASVRWSRKGAGEISSSTKYEITYTDQVAILTIVAVTSADDDDYTCKATNSVGSVETTCHLSVTNSQRKSSSSVLHRVPSSLNTDTTSLPLQQYSSPQGLQRTRYTSGGASNGVSEAQEACDHTTTRNNGGSHLLIARSAACGSLILYSHWYGLADVRNLLMMAKSFPCYTLDRVNQKLQMDLALTNLVFTIVTNCCH